MAGFAASVGVTAGDRRRGRVSQATERYHETMIDAPGMRPSRGLALLLVALTLIGLAVRPPPADGRTMKLASATVGDVQHEWQKLFKAGVEARAGGRLVVEIYPASRLGPTPEMLAGVLSGAIESFIAPTAFVAGTEPRFAIFDTPGLFDDPGHVARVIHDPTFRERVFGYGRDQGLRAIAIIYNSPMVVASRRPIRILDDFKGRKVRTFASPMQTVPIARLGAEPVPLSLSAVRPALRRGTIDALLAGMPILTAFAFHEFTPAVTAIHSSAVISINIVNRDWFEGLPEDLRRIVLTEAGRAEQAVFPWAIANLARADRAWRARGGEIIRLPAADQARMMAEMAAAGAEVLRADRAVFAEFQVLRQLVEAAR